MPNKATAVPALRARAGTGVLSLLACLAIPVSLGAALNMARISDVPVPADPVAVAVRPGNGEIWVSMQDGSLGVIDPETLQMVDRVEDVGTGAWGLAFHPNGESLYRTSWLANELVVVDASERRIRNRIAVGLKPAFLQVSDDGKRAWVSNFFSGELSIVDLETETNLRDLDVGRRPMGLVVEPLGQYAMLSSGVSHMLKVVDLEKQQVVMQREVDFAGTHNLDLRYDGAQLLAPGWPDLLLTLDLKESDAEVKAIKVGTDPVGVVLAPDEKFAFVTNYRDATFSVVDLDQGKTVANHPTGKGPMFMAVDEKAGRLYICSSKEQSVTVYSIH